MQLDPALLAPEEHGFAGHLRAVIKSQRMWPTTALDDLIEPPRHPDPGDANIHQLPDTQARIVVDNVQDPDPPTASQADHGRCLLTSTRLGAVATSSSDAVVAAFFAAGCEPACPALYTVDKCAPILHQTLSLEQAVQQQIAIARIPFAQRLQPLNHSGVACRAHGLIMQRLAADAHQRAGAPLADSVDLLKIAGQLLTRGRPHHFFPSTS
jgi:hypothetical protein